MKLLNCFSAFTISAAIIIASSSTAAQSRTCYGISDPDGFVNMRDRESGEVITSIDTTQNVFVDGFDGESAILASPHNQFFIHRSRLKPIRSGRCFRFTSIEADGYLNLRESPQGKIISRIVNGTALLTLSATEGSWVRVLVPDGQVGYVYSTALEIYTYRD
jgi:Bacterial SH3 domain